MKQSIKNQILFRFLAAFLFLSAITTVVMYRWLVELSGAIYDEHLLTRRFRCRKDQI